MDRAAIWSDEEIHRELSAIKQKKLEATWYLVVGVAMLFMSGFFWGLAAGGVLMVGYGAWRHVVLSLKMRRMYDPWKDAEIDAWEEEQLRRS